MTFKALIDAASTVTSLRDFILGGNFAELFADAELAAAKEALRKSNLARNPQGQVWSAVNHLETAHHAYQKEHKSKDRPWDSMGAATHYAVMRNKDAYSLTLMATCYAFLKEKSLCRQALDEAEGIMRFRDLGPNNFQALRMMIDIWDPRYWYKAFSGKFDYPMELPEFLELKEKLIR